MTRLLPLSGLFLMLLTFFSADCLSAASHGPHHRQTGIHPAEETGTISISGSDRDSTDKDFVVGLALSGGGAAGLAHVGVIKVLEEAGIHIDVVTGTSMGAIVGGLYAIGYSTSQLEEEVYRTDWRGLFEERIERKHLPMEEKPYDGIFNLTFPFEGRKINLPTGLVSGNHIFNRLARLTWNYHDVVDFTSFPRPFLCIAADIETGEQVILDSGYLPNAIRASMSIPSIFDPVWIDDRYLVDGGIVNNLPVKEAFDLGADLVIAVNSSSDLRLAHDLRNLSDILTQTISVGIRSYMLEQEKLADFVIRPDLQKFSTLGFGDVKDIVMEGENAARARMDELKALADTIEHQRQERHLSDSVVKEIPPYEMTSTLNIRNISFEGLETVPEEHILSKLQIESNTTVHEETLSDGLMRLHGMQRFKSVNYRLEWSGDRDYADLVLMLEEQTSNAFQVGIFHNNTLGPSLLFTTTFRNLLHPASTARVTSRIGHEAKLGGEYFNYIGLEPRLAFQAAGGFREREIDVYDDDRRLANLRTDIFYAEGLIGPLYGSVFRAGFGYRLEHFNLTESVGVVDVPERWNTLHLLSGEIEFDNLDRSVLPRSGQNFRVRGDYSAEFLPGDHFGRISGKWTGHYRVISPLALIHTIRGGYTFGDNIPLHYRFYAGGYQDFPGFKKDSVTGNNILSAGIAGRYHLYSNFYATIGVHAGNTYDNLNFDVFDKSLLWGWTTALSWDTVLGPVEVALSGSRQNTVLLEFQIGLNFRDIP